MADHEIVALVTGTPELRAPGASDRYAVPRSTVHASGADAVFAEKADHSETPAAGYGYLWVKSDTPNTLMFTDDAGNDFALNKRPEKLVVPVSDETTDLTTGTAKLTFRFPCKFYVTAVRASVNTAPTGAALQVDINESGVSILSTVLSIDATEKTSTTAATPAVISDANIADDAEITIDIDQIGSTVAGAGLKVTFIGYEVP